MDLSHLAALFRHTVQEWTEDQASNLAAALSYYTTFSFAPVLVLVIAIAGLLGGRDAAQGLVMQEVRALLGIQGEEFVEGMIANAAVKSAGITASILGTLALLVGALGVFNQLQQSLNNIWDVKPEPAGGWKTGIVRFASRRLISFSMLLAIGFLLLVFLVISAALAAVSDYFALVPEDLQWLLQGVNLVISLVIITILFALIFRYIPDADVPWRSVWPGAALTAILFSIGKYLIGFYLGKSDVGSAFGAAGTLVLIMIWIYYSSQILFFGAEFTQVYAKDLRPSMSPQGD